MGQRANLIIGNESSYELFYSHWCANTLPRDLFWGPAHAIDFISQQRRVDPGDGWLDTIWAEGGAVVDTQRKKLLLFGGEDVLYDVPFRRVFLRLLDAAWDDWTIDWAYEGIVEIAEYVGLPRDSVIPDSSTDDGCAQSLRPPEEHDWLQCIGTFETHDGLKIFPLPGLLEDYVLAGPQLLQACESESYLEILDVADWTSEFPTGGFHVNVAKRTVDFWMATDCPNLFCEAREAWKDWSVTWRKDEYESHALLTNSALVMNPRSEQKLIADAVALLDQDSIPVDVLDLAQRISEHQNEKVEVNPLAIRDDRISVDSERRRGILEQCVAAIRSPK